MGLATSSAVVHLQKNDATYDIPIYSNSVNGKFTKHFHIFHAQIDSFYYFHLLTLLCSAILALQACALILGYAVRIFHITDAKYILFGVS